MFSEDLKFCWSIIVAEFCHKNTASNSFSIGNKKQRPLLRVNKKYQFEMNALLQVN